MASPKCYGSRALQVARQVFHWKYVNWVTGLSISSMFGAVMGDKYFAAYVLCAVTATFACGSWFFSNTFIRHFWRPIKLYGASDNDEIMMGSPRWRWIVVPTVTGLVFFSAVVYKLTRLETAFQLNQLYGVLQPANEPDPVLQTPVVPDEFVLHAGTNCFITNTFPIVVASIRGKRALVLDKTSDGAIAITLKVWDENGKLIVELDRNKFEISPNNYFRKSRPDKSTLIVQDQRGETVLEAHYANRRSMRLTARIRYPNGTLLDITGSEILNRICIARRGLAFFQSFIDFR